jgi:hypothetical protein
MYLSSLSDFSSIRRTRYTSEVSSIAQIRSVAADAISTLKNAGIEDACFVGGMACNLFGNPRQPNVRTIPASCSLT